MSNVTDSAPSSDDGRALNHQHNNDHQTESTHTKLADRRQLIKAFWSNFACCNDDDPKKVKWLDLFITEFNRLISDVNAVSPTSSTKATITQLSSDQCRFVSPAAASQLTCYLLQLVHEIILSAAIEDVSQSTPAAQSTSTVSPARALNDITVASHSSTATTRIDFSAQPQPASSKVTQSGGLSRGRYARGIAMLNADITTIVVLREFLMHGVGGRILEVLLMIDTTNMLCARELTGLLINLFPTSAWESPDPEIANNTREIMTDLEQQSAVLTRLEAVIRNSQRSHHRKSVRIISHPTTTNAATAHKTHTDDDTVADADVPLSSHSCNPDVNTYTLPEFPQLTGDYIGSLVLNLIQKLVREDAATHAHLTAATVHLPPPLDAGSVTVQCLHFALDTYATMAKSAAFRPANNAILSQRLLVIVCRALIGVFAKPAICDAVCVDSVVDLCDLVQRMLATTERLFEGVSDDDAVAEHRVGVCLALALILQRCVQGGVGDGLSTENANDDADDADTAVSQTQHLTSVLANHTAFIVRLLVHVERVDGGIAFVKCITHLQHVVRTLRSSAMHQHEQPSPPQQHQHHRRRSSRPVATRKRSHMSSLNACIPQRPNHRSPHHHLHRRSDTLACVLERILLQLAASASVAAHLRHIYRHFQLNAPCCCNTPTASELERLLTATRAAGCLPFGLQYVRNSILRPMFGCGTRSLSVGPTSPQQLRHIVCEPCDRRRLQFATDCVFVHLYTQLATSSTPTELPLLLRHLAKVAKYLPFDSACRVLAEVLLPQFRRHKASSDGHAATSPVLALCLNAFLCYLRDIRLIKAFFNDDNIQHLGDLIGQPPVASLVCCLVRIGVDNASYLGENCGEQQALAERLHRLQADSVLAVTATMAGLFRAVSECDVQLVRMEATVAGGGDWDSNGRGKLSLMARLERRELSVTELLQLAVVYWNQQLQSVRRASTVDGQLAATWTADGLSALVQNTLTCFLYSRPIFIDVYDLEGVAVERCFAGDREAESRFVWVPLDREEDELNGVVDADQRPIGPSRSMYGASTEVEDVANTATSSYLSSGTPSLRASTSELIYDLRQARSEHNHLHTVHNPNAMFGLDTNTTSLMYSSYDDGGGRASTVDLSRFVATGTINDAAVVADATQTDDDDGAADSGDTVDHANPPGGVVLNMFQFISDNVWELLFPATARQTRAVELLAEQQQLAAVFGSVNDRMRIVELPENKRLFLQLFEIACGVLMCDGVFEKAASTELGGGDGDVDSQRQQRPTAMTSDSATGNEPAARSRVLHQLKTILLRHAEHIHESEQNGAAIVAALQSLLKCAEMRYRCCMVDDCEHASYAQAPGCGGGVEAVTTTSSLKSGGTVGDNMCCAASLQTVNFDGGGGGGGSEANVIDPHGLVAAAVGADSYSSDADVTDGDEEKDDDELMDGLLRNADGGGAAGLRRADRGSSDGSYITADEGYDGDAELAASLDSDNDASDAPTTHHYADASADPNSSAQQHARHGDDDDDMNPLLLASAHASTTPASRYRQPIIHADICRIVVDILIELSKRCLDEPDFWPVYLLPITQRFTAIRESLGGSLYLLRGFAPVLESNDGRLRELQRAILGLVTEVSAPETLTAYLALLANGERPPMELLLGRLFNLGSASHRVKPVAEMRFPTRSDGTLFEGDQIHAEVEEIRIVRDAIVDMRRSHRSQRLCTALTRSTYLLPIPIDACDFRPWAVNAGFTVAVWLNIRPHAGRVTAAASQSSGFGVQSERCSNEGSAKTSKTSRLAAGSPGPWDDKTHLLSVGSDRLMLSIYLHTHDPATMFFQLTRPDTPSTNERTSPTTAGPTAGRMPRSYTHDGNYDERLQQQQQPPHFRNRANSHTVQTDPIGLNVLTSTALAFQTTRIALRNSLSQFNLFVSSSASAAAASASMSAGHADRDFKSLRYPLEVKGVRLQRNRWTHVAFSVQTNGTEMSIRITIDGLDQHDIRLACAMAACKHEQFTVLCVGDSHSVAEVAAQSSVASTTVTADQLDVVDIAYSLANVQLFRRCITASVILATLVAVGPDATDFVPCALGNTVPNYGYLNPLRLGDVLRFVDNWESGAQSMQCLREALALTFSATDTRAAIARPKETAAAGQRIPAMSNGWNGYACATAVRPIPSLQTAIVMCGGISALCFLFARVVEQCPDAEQLQAATLSFVLRTVHTSSALYSEFCRTDGMRLLSAVIRSQRCRRGVPLLGAILDIACDQAVLVRRPGLATIDQQLAVCTTTSASVVHAELVVTVLRRYADWHSATRPNGAVIETLLLAVQALVREKHPRQAANLGRLREAGLVPALLHFCKIYLVGVATPVPLTDVAARALVGLVGTFAGAPPAAALLDDLIKVLLLLHQPSDSFITHDRSKFYFLVTPAVPQRPRNRLSLPHLVTAGRRSIGAGFVSTASGHASSSSSAASTVSVLRTRKSTPVRQAANKTKMADDGPVSPTSPTSPKSPAPHTSAYQAADLSAIADCSRGPPATGRWSLNELDVVAAGGAAQLQQLQRHQRGGGHRSAIGVIVSRRRLLDGNRRRPTGTAATRQHRRTRSALAMRRSTGRNGGLCPASGAGGRSSSETNVSESGFDECMSGLVNQYDIIATDDNADEVEPLPPQRRPTSFASSQSSQSRQSAHNVASAHGVRAIQTGFFGLLTDFILILPDTTIHDVLAHYVTVDVVLVLANHRDTAVRAAIVRLLAAMCQRLGDAALAHCHRSHSWLHCGNQVALHPVDEALVLACCRWVTGAGPAVQSIDQMTSSGGRVRIADRVGLHALLAVLPQTAGDERLLRPCVQLVERLYADAELEQRQYMVEHGVVAALAKGMQQFVQRWGAGRDETGGQPLQQQREFVDAVLVHCALTIGGLAMRGCGSINVLWDLLNVLTFFEDTRNVTVVAGVRRYQADVLHQLVMTFLPPQRLAAGCDSKFSFSEVTLNTSNLSAAEVRTRFELLIDRSVQFITTVEPTHQLTDAELRLTQFLIQMTVAGLHRSATLLTWSLCPARPLTLKLHTVHTLHQYVRHAPAATLSACTDLKLMRCMLAAVLATDYEICSPSDQERLVQLASAAGLPRPNVVTHLSHTLDKLESVRQSALRDQRPAIERTVHRPEPAVQPCIDAAMRCTRAVVELQNAERRQLINAMRAGDDEMRLAADWRRLVERMTHEAAPWHAARVYPRSWQLDETEGPGRARTRLRRCHLSVANRFLMAGVTPSDECSRSLPSTASDTDTTIQPPPPEPLHYLRESLVQRPHFPLNDRVLYTFACSHLPVDCEHDGELIVTESHLIFVPNAVDREPVRLSCADITEIWPRRHQHRNVGLEFYQADRRSAFFVFGGGGDATAAGGDLCVEREQLMRFFADKVVQPGASEDAKLVALTKHWSEGDLTNWEYLMQLNQISGRSYQDLMQYPVLPWILSDYTSPLLDLGDPAAFRRLDRPIAVQSEASEAHYLSNYTYLQQAQQEMARSYAAAVAAAAAAAGSSTSGGGSSNSSSPTAAAAAADAMALGSAGSHMQPYHYGSHYSNSGTVLHYLVRVPPFTNFFLRYQDNSFDLPDRTFHSMHTTWRLASRDSPTDVKELIPEFFTLPEMLENFESFQFGQRQSGERVDNVALPPWSGQSARLFVLIHRQALESDAVRTQLHRWVDLVFGWRQTGAAAVQAINVFHPATYIGFSAANGTDPVERKAFETMVRTYGQMPRQLFHYPHTAAIVPLPPPDEPNNSSSPTSAPSVPTDPAAMMPVRVRGLRWGHFTGSPQLAEPIVVKHFHVSPAAAMLIALPLTNVCYSLPAGSNLMQGPEPDTMNVVAWHEADGIVRVRRLTDADISVVSSHRRDSDARPLCATSAADPITACGSNAAATQLWFGHRSGRLAVHRYAGTANRQQQRLNKTRYVQHSAPFTLASYNSAFRHRAGGGGDGGLKSTDNADSSTAQHTFGRSHHQSASATSGWLEPIVLVRHTDQVTGIALSDEFRVCVSVGLDGAACIWDANTLVYVRCIEPPSICRPGTPIRLVTVSPTMGDIVTVHALDDRTRRAGGGADVLADVQADVGLEATEAAGEEDELNDDDEVVVPSAATTTTGVDDAERSAAAPCADFVSVRPQNVAGGRSVLRVHTINARYVGHVVDAERIECVAYSAVREGTGINVIAAGYADGTVRLWSSWDLTLVRVLPALQAAADLLRPVQVVPVASVAFSTYQHLVVLTRDGAIRVWQSDRLAGPAPKFSRVAAGGEQTMLRWSG